MHARVLNVKNPSKRDLRRESKTEKTKRSLAE